MRIAAGEVGQKITYFLHHDLQVLLSFLGSSARRISDTGILCGLAPLAWGPSLREALDLERGALPPRQPPTVDAPGVGRCGA